MAAGRHHTYRLVNSGTADEFSQKHAASSYLVKDRGAATGEKLKADCTDFADYKHLSFDS
jgi:hypothetical protein